MWISTPINDTSGRMALIWKRKTRSCPGPTNQELRKDVLTKTRGGAYRKARLPKILPPGNHYRTWKEAPIPFLSRFPNQSTLYTPAFNNHFVRFNLFFLVKLFYPLARKQENLLPHLIYLSLNLWCPTELLWLFSHFT